MFDWDNHSDILFHIFSSYERSLTISIVYQTRYLLHLQLTNQMEENVHMA